MCSLSGLSATWSSRPNIQQGSPPPEMMVKCLIQRQKRIWRREIILYTSVMSRKTGSDEALLKTGSNSSALFEQHKNKIKTKSFPQIMDLYNGWPTTGEHKITDGRPSTEVGGRHVLALQRPRHFICTATTARLKSNSLTRRPAPVSNSYLIGGGRSTTIIRVTFWRTSALRTPGHPLVRIGVAVQIGSGHVEKTSFLYDVYNYYADFVTVCHPGKRF